MAKHRAIRLRKHSTALKTSFIQVKILKHRAEGMQLKEIAKMFGLSHKTIEYHWKNVMKYIGLHDIALITQWALYHGVAEWTIPTSCRKTLSGVQ